MTENIESSERAEINCNEFGIITITNRFNRLINCSQQQTLVLYNYVNRSEDILKLALSIPLFLKGYITLLFLPVLLAVHLV